MDKKKEDLIFIHPRKVEKAKIPPERVRRPYPPSEITHEDDAEDSYWRKDGVYIQILKTYEKIKEKEIRDEELAYYVLETYFDVHHPSSLKVIEKLNAKILFYINPNKSRVLVESPLKNLEEITERRRLKYIENNIHLIRPLRINEKISEEDIDIEWLNKNPRIIIEIIPNIDIEKRGQYLEKIINYITKWGIEKIESPAEDYLRSKGLIIAKASLSQSKMIAENSNLIYKVFKTPKLKKGINNIKISKIVKNPSAYDINKTKLYRVCVVDTGINKIKQLTDLIENSSYENIFPDGTDQDNHGTPISCLVTHGEGFDDLKPLFKIISHKVFSENLNQGDLFNGLINAIELYENITKLFISSCNFLYDGEEERNLTARLNKLIQEKNVGVIFCCGNIPPPYDPKNYPAYIELYKTQHPSDAISITSVGSLVKHINDQSVAPINGPSPFSRLGSSFNLFESIKPEVVQHGGNCSPAGDKAGIGVKTFSNLGERCETVGTSFASPLFARIMANIYDHYGGQFRNSETARAIAYSCCKKGVRFSKYLGFGESNLHDSISTSWNSTKIVFEGNLPLERVKNEQEYDVYDEIRFIVPSGVSDIELTIVHTDNYYRYLKEPKLHSYLSITTWKPGRESPVIRGDIFPGDLSYAKKISWQYSRGTVGSWTFEIHPKNLGIPKSERSEVTIRYGGVIELTARKSRLESLTELFKAANGIL